MSQISLFSHNQTAYAALLPLLAETGRACVIHPTGTGKSFIAFRYCEDHPSERVLWLSPSEYIYRIQCQNLRAAGAEVPGNIQFCTYAKLSQLSDGEIAAFKADVVIEDEFHRCGARFWQTGLERLLRVFPAAGQIGLSATSVRYLDNHRDMGAELFGGCIASEMTLGEAIVRGILKSPTYVLSAYAYEQSFEQLQARVRRVKSPAVRDEAERSLDALRRAIDQADGLDQVFERHIQERTGRFLVFSSTREHMARLMEKASFWFRRVDAAPHIYSVSAEDAASRRTFQAFQEDNSAHLKLLFSVDMLNEGVHVEGVNGVVLMRPTVSPIIYKQQIGRALSASRTETPVIFDIVNNVENLYSVGSIEQEMRNALRTMRARGQEDAIVADHFHVIDELRDSKQLFEHLEETLSASWDLMYRCAEGYRRKYGDLEVPPDYKTPEGYSLGAWVQTQRKIRAGTALGSLGQERIEKLDALGMRWEWSDDYHWARNLSACRRYREERGDLAVPTRYVSPEGIALGAWLSRLRGLHKRGEYSAYFTHAREAELEALGIVWDRAEHAWERGYTQARDYYHSHGNLNVPKGTGPLYGWLVEQRQIRRGKRQGRSLSAEQVARLDALGMVWKPQTQRGWARGLEEAGAYAREHGVLDAPAAYVTPSGYPLGAWLSRCRGKYADGTLTGEQAAALEALGLRWNLRRENDWEQCFRFLKDYRDTHGDLRVPPDYVVQGVWLYKWMNEQKQILRGKRKGKSLTPAQREKLASLGFTLESANEQKWNRQFAAVRAYYDTHGNLNIPTGYTTQDGLHPYKWLANQRVRWRAGQLGERERKLLSELGFSSP